MFHKLMLDLTDVKVTSCKKTGEIRKSQLYDYRGALGKIDFKQCAERQYQQIDAKNIHFG